MGGSGVHLSPQVHQEYVYKLKSSHRALTKDLRHLKGQEKDPSMARSDEEEKGKKKERGNRMGPTHLGSGEPKERRGFAPREAPFLAAKYTEPEGDGA